MVRMNEMKWMNIFALILMQKRDETIQLLFSFLNSISISKWSFILVCAEGNNQSFKKTFNYFDHFIK